jgi:hypothetical protein
MTTASDAFQPGTPGDSASAAPHPHGNIVAAEVAPPAELSATPSVMWPKLEAFLDAASDRLNPILVKEARQAMKSKQFSVTFTLLLIVGWVYTLLFVVLNLPGVFYSPLGSAMLFGYYLILTVPLLIVVPYASFRSLAAELEDGTFDLLSITALGARQIVLGKLGSSVLQMLVYYSALAPCIAFTYLLRGIDVVTIALLLTWTFMASLLLSILALTLSTVTRARHWQVLLSVLLVIALLLFGFFWCMSMISVLATASMLPYDQSWFWMLNVAILSFYVPLSILFVLIAAGQVTFASENRSTGVRIVLLILQMLIVGWTTYGFFRVEEEEVLMVGAGFLGALWAIAGAFLIGETAQLSPRARRELPQSLLGRMAFTWFNPGSGTGYVFAMVSALGGMLTMFVTGLSSSIMMGSGGIGGIDTWTAWWLAILSYLAIYLGLARLFGVASRALNMGGGMLGVFVAYILLLVMGIFLPLSVQSLVNWATDYTFGDFEYTMMQLPNWFWTLIEIGDNKLVISEGSIWLLLITAGIVFLLNFVLAAKEVEQTRIAAPTRVLEDELELHPLPKPAKKNPWDDEPAAVPASPAGDSTATSTS